MNRIDNVFMSNELAQTRDCMQSLQPLRLIPSKRAFMWLKLLRTGLFAMARFLYKNLDVRYSKQMANGVSFSSANITLMGQHNIEIL